MSLTQHFMQATSSGEEGSMKWSLVADRTTEISWVLISYDWGSYEYVHTEYSGLTVNLSCSSFLYRMHHHHLSANPTKAAATAFKASFVFQEIEKRLKEVQTSDVVLNSVVHCVVYRVDQTWWKSWKLSMSSRSKMVQAAKREHGLLMQRQDLGQSSTKKVKSQSAIMCRNTVFTCRYTTTTYRHTH